MPVTDRLREAVFEVVAQLDLAHPAEGGADPRDLLHDVDTVCVVLDHADDALNVTPCRLETPKDVSLALWFHPYNLPHPGRGAQVPSNVAFGGGARQTAGISGITYADPIDELPQNEQPHHVAGLGSYSGAPARTH